MSLFSAIASRIKSVTRIAKLSYNQAAGRSVSIKMIDSSNIEGRMRGVATAVGTGDIARAHLEEIAKIYVAELSAAASKIHSTGALEDSFSYAGTGKDTVSIFSDSPYAMSWLPNGNEGKPPVSNLASWIENTATFNGFSEKEKRRVAFAIQRASITGVGLGSTGLSRLSLDSSGKRIFDYRKMAHDNVMKQVAMMGVPVSEVL